jgi:hypothetical protein
VPVSQPGPASRIDHFHPDTAATTVVGCSQPPKHIIRSTGAVPTMTGTLECISWTPDYRARATRAQRQRSLASEEVRVVAPACPSGSNRPDRARPLDSRVVAERARAVATLVGLPHGRRKLLSWVHRRELGRPLAARNLTQTGWSEYGSCGSDVAVRLRCEPSAGGFDPVFLTRLIASFRLASSVCIDSVEMASMYS